MPSARSRVAIACQGGGSHTSFTAGVLQGLMAALPDDADVVALTGTPAGPSARRWPGRASCAATRGGRSPS